MNWDSSPTPSETSGSDSDNMDTSVNKQAPLDLILSLFVDWFNPRGNKISGKVESTGIFALTCLNLPPILRNKISHICLAGITPRPYSPDTSTIGHLLKPIVNELRTLDSGVTIKTHQHPNGRWVRVRLLCLIGDLPATKKIASFASPSATYFCTWCHAKNDSINTLAITAKRWKSDTMRAAQRSRDAKSINAQDTILKQTGVRWSELNRLRYWDASKHVVLGIMHNWLEGVLQAHWRHRWKFVAVTETSASKKRRRHSTLLNSKRQRSTLEASTISTR
ncbi:hypothetical protein MJO29_008554 [Puccinia striiformis f. sp. tritici]|nr:hypothetical protein MJO29_008554 [Puccinia striiformis f. sp. tritici]